MMNIKKLSDFELKGKLVLLRLDINSPVSKGQIEDSPRLRETETIRYLSKHGAKTVIIAHQGRKGDGDFVSLKKHASFLTRHSKIKIEYVDSLFEVKALKAINDLKEGGVLLLKNVRSYDDETDVNKKDNRYFDFCKNFDVFVNDAFSVSHRSQGSIVIPPKFLPSCMGLAMEKELSALNKMGFSKKGVVYLVGGAKLDDYIPIFDNLKRKNNILIASGVLANMLLIAKGHDLGYEKTWLTKEGYMSLLPQLEKIIEKYDNQIVLPVDLAVSKNGKREEINLDDFPSKDKILDVGEKTVSIIKSKLLKTGAVFMKGPLGFSEINGFSKGTVEVLREISMLSKKKKLFSLLGGGHLTTTAEKYKVPNNFSHISTSGGALIAYISGKELPGLKVLEK